MLSIFNALWALNHDTTLPLTIPFHHHGSMTTTTFHESIVPQQMSTVRDIHDTATIYTWTPRDSSTTTDTLRSSGPRIARSTTARLFDALYTSVLLSFSSSFFFSYCWNSFRVFLSTPVSVEYRQSDVILSLSIFVQLKTRTFLQNWKSFFHWRAVFTQTLKNIHFFIQIFDFDFLLWKIIKISKSHLKITFLG